MRAGRAGTLARAMKYNREGSRPSSASVQRPVEQASQEGETSVEDEVIDVQDINLQDNTKKRIVFRKFPVALWLVGILIAILGLYCLYHVALGFLGVPFEGFSEGHWWQWLIVAALFVLSFVFLFAGRIESVIFDKDANEFTRVKFNIFCVKTSKTLKISDISDIRVEKRGFETVHSSTKHFKIIIDFRNKQSVTLLESKKEEKVITQVLFIKRFIGMRDSAYGNHVQIDDVMDQV